MIQAKKSDIAFSDILGSPGQADFEQTTYILVDPVRVKSFHAYRLSGVHNLCKTAEPDMKTSRRV